MATSTGIRTCIRSLVSPRYLPRYHPSVASNQRVQWVSTETKAESNTGKVQDAESPEDTGKQQGDQQKEAQPTNVDKKLQEEKTKLEKQVEELTDKYKRALAETENVRTRFKKQLDDSRLYSIQGFCKDLLEVADILGDATTSIPTEQLEGSNVSPHLKSLFEGLKMTETQLQKVFSKNNLHQINPLNEKFNPNLHEALFETVIEGKEPGTVGVVTKIGYKLHDRTIRPAFVGVAKAP